VISTATYVYKEGGTRISGRGMGDAAKAAKLDEASAERRLEEKQLLKSKSD
jgi:hypothetical protein